MFTKEIRQLSNEEKNALFTQRGHLRFIASYFKEHGTLPNLYVECALRAYKS